MKLPMLLAAVLVAAPAAAEPEKAPPNAGDAAARFQLDLAPAEEDSAVAAPAAPAPAPATAPAARFTLDTPIAQLLADWRSKAVLDRDMPGLSTDKNLDKFKALSLNGLAPLSGGRVSLELLATLAEHLGEIE